MLEDAPTYYQCIPWMLWQYTAHEPEVHAAIAAMFMRPCLYVSRDAQQEVFEHLAWLSGIVLSVRISDCDWECAQTDGSISLLAAGVGVGVGEGEGAGAGAACRCLVFGWAHES